MILRKLKRILGGRKGNKAYKLPNKCKIYTDGHIEIANSSALSKNIQYLIGPGSCLVIMDGANVSEGVQLTALNGGRIFIGRNVHIGRFVQINAMGGDVYIKDDVVCINDFSILTAWEKIEIGQNTLIAPFCHIMDRDHGFNKEDLIRNQLGIVTPVFIGNDCWLGSGSVILKGVRINDGAVIGARSVVTSEIPAYAIAAGSPAKILKYRD